MPEKVSRRSLLRTAPLAVPAAFHVVKPNLVRGAGKETIKIGLVGCGGRGTAAVIENITANDNVDLTAMADVFEDKLESSLRRLREADFGPKRYEGMTIMRDGKPHKLTAKEVAEKVPKHIKVPPDQHFVGQDAYEKLLKTDIDAVMLITPPGHRPLHFEAAVNAGKHVFIEKPIATCPVGARRVMEAGRKAIERNLTVVSGTESRYKPENVETVKKIHDGAIGEIVAAYAYWYGNAIFKVPERKPEWTETQWQHRNWYSFTWICGDQLVEQSVHYVDIINWIMQAHPIKAIGNGGRAWRDDDNPLHGDVFDIMDCELTYPNGTKLITMSRHFPAEYRKRLPQITGPLVIGTKGRSTGSDMGSKVDPYVSGNLEQRLFINSIRGDGPYVNNVQATAVSTMSAIMAREAAYSGQEITWDQVMKSQLDLYPKELLIPGKDIPPLRVRVPGEYKFV